MGLEWQPLSALPDRCLALLVGVVTGVVVNPVDNAINEGSVNCSLKPKIYILYLFNLLSYQWMFNRLCVSDLCVWFSYDLLNTGDLTDPVWYVAYCITLFCFT